MRHLIHFFDRLEDKVREFLSRHPIVYSLVGGVAIVLFWRGVWHTADDLMLPNFGTAVVAALVLALSGIFVSFFIGDSILISGLKGEKKVIDKTKDEVLREANVLKDIQKEVTVEAHSLADVREELKNIRHLLEEIRNR